MIAAEDTVWYLSWEALKSEPQRSVSELLHSIRDAKVPVQAALFEIVKVAEVPGKFGRTTFEVNHDRFRIERDAGCR